MSDTVLAIMRSFPGMMMQTINKEVAKAALSGRTPLHLMQAAHRCQWGRDTGVHKRLCMQCSLIN